MQGKESIIYQLFNKLIVAKREKKIHAPSEFRQFEQWTEKANEL
jgi:hypothetical protein